MEFVVGAAAACSAGVISNPMDLLKTRMQLQGELKARGQYTVVYKNVFHAAVAVAKTDGLLGLQKGLVAASSYQVVMNGIRFGLYRRVLDSGIISRPDGTVSPLGCVAAGASVGILGGFIGSPFFLVKIHLQSQAAKSIAVGHQHQHEGFFHALVSIARAEGIRGLWRGSSTSIPRVGIGSASQLFTYSKSKDWLSQYGGFSKDSWEGTLCAAMTSGLIVSTCMSPFDVVATRIYNQGTDHKGKGQVYKGIFDCIMKVARSEGIRGFYKGFSAIYLRVGPHSFFNLVFWDYYTRLYLQYSGKKEMVGNAENEAKETKE